MHPHLGDRSGFTFRADQVITGTKSEHALPLGVITIIMMIDDDDDDDDYDDDDYYYGHEF